MLGGPTDPIRIIVKRSELVLRRREGREREREGASERESERDGGMVIDVSIIANILCQCCESSRGVRTRSALWYRIIHRNIASNPSPIPASEAR